MVGSHETATALRESAHMPQQPPSKLLKYDVFIHNLKTEWRGVFRTLPIIYDGEVLLPK